LLWTNPKDIVFSPFMGIGSECFVAIKNGRHAVGIELKESYFKQSVLNMVEAERLSKAPKQITFADVIHKELIE